MSKVMLACGHTAKPEDPVCLSCDGIREGSRTIVGLPDLAGRKAQCIDCDKTVDSSVNLPFFRYYPSHQNDAYYCGCYGWD